MYIAILVRRLKPGKTYEDFVAAWYPEKGFGVPVRGPDLGVNIADGREIASVAYVDVPDGQSLDDVMNHVADQESVRHSRISDVIEETLVHGIYEVRDRYDFSSGETVDSERGGSLSKS